jgi:hypothetical protein
MNMMAVIAISPASVRLRPASGLPNALHRQALSANGKIPHEQTIGRGNFPA